MLHYSAEEPTLQVWGPTAVCVYRWTMTYQREGAPLTESGTDQFVLGLRDGAWLVLWRLMLFEPAAS